MLITHRSSIEVVKQGHNLWTGTYRGGQYRGTFLEPLLVPSVLLEKCNVFGTINTFFSLFWSVLVTRYFFFDLFAMKLYKLSKGTRKIVYPHHRLQFRGLPHYGSLRCDKKYNNLTCHAIEKYFVTSHEILNRSCKPLWALHNAELIGLVVTG